MQMRPSCERCGAPLPPDSGDAYVCSFECTFCAACVGGALRGACPNCGGELVARPRRAAAAAGTLLTQAQPVLPVRDLPAALAFYAGRLGFEGVMVDSPEDPRYAALRRDGVEIHLQWHDAAEWERIERPSIRFLVQGVDALHAELRGRGAPITGAAPRDTPWGTREFGVYDPDGNALHFYQDLPAR